MKEILKIKQHKMTVAVAQLNRCEKVFTLEQKKLLLANQNIEEHMIWQREESDRLFDAIKKTPVTMIQLENYNAELAKMMYTLNELMAEQKIIENNVIEAKNQVDTAKILLNLAHQKQEKFQHLNEIETKKNKIDSERQDDELLDEIVDAIYVSADKPAQNFGEL
jgi:hypothetical protein